ncbi:MAG: hypothetical protein NTY81_01335 [Candidatus Staskawiczbacteria bacterium]|nr:hypothetical protein [Candidatus Staskawiczbacteria bacterium]
MGEYDMNTHTFLVVLLVTLMAGMSAMAAGGDNTLPTVVSASASMPTVSLPDALPMITSRKALFSYAKEQVASAQKWIGSPGILTGKTYTSVTGSDPDVRKIVSSVVKDLLEFGAMDTSLQLTFGMNFSDSYGAQLFFGQNQFYPVPGPGGWAVPNGADSVVMEMANEIPISLPGVTSAFALVKPAGETQPQWVPLNAWNNGRFFFPTSLTGLEGAGWSGQLAVYTGGNVPTVYDIGTGASVDPEMFEVGGNATFDNTVFLDDPNDINLGVGKAAVYANPVFQVSFKTSRIVKLFGVSPTGELAEHVLIRKIGVGMTEALSYTVIPSQDLRVQFDAGCVYDVWFDFDDWDQDQPSIPPYYYGDGGMG